MSTPSVDVPGATAPPAISGAPQPAGAPERKPIVARQVIDLGTAHSTPGLQVPVFAPFLVVAQVDSPATVRIGSPYAEPIPLLTGMIETPPDADIIGFVYVENDAGASGDQAVLIPMQNVRQTTQAAVTSTGSALATISPTNGVLTDHSGTTVAGDNTVLAAGSRKYLMFQNLGSGDMYVNFGAAATAAAGSYKILAGGVLVMEASFVCNQEMHVYDVAGTQDYTLKVG